MVRIVGRSSFRQIAEEDEDKAVALLYGVCIDSRPLRNFFQRAERWNSFASAVAGEQPAVIGALHAVADDLAVTERTAAVSTGVRDTVRLAVLVPPEHEP